VVLPVIFILLGGQIGPKKLVDDGNLTVFIIKLGIDYYYYYIAHLPVRCYRTIFIEIGILKPQTENLIIIVSNPTIGSREKKQSTGTIIQHNDNFNT
jgi:hypothetical protein